MAKKALRVFPAIFLLLYSCLASSPNPQSGTGTGVPRVSTVSYVNDPSSPVMCLTASGRVKYGDWTSLISVEPKTWAPGATVSITADLTLTEGLYASLTQAGVKPDQASVLVTAERAFDGQGRMHLPLDDRMSTLLTPSGLAIEGGTMGAVTKRFGGAYTSPFDEYAAAPLIGTTAHFRLSAVLPADLPPGIYRVRFDWGIVQKKRQANLNLESFSSRPFTFEQDGWYGLYVYTPPIPASGVSAAGDPVEAASIRPAIPWVILGQYNSNGYRGVVADEERGRFALSDRNIIPDDVILPLYKSGMDKYVYSLEPELPADLIDPGWNIPWDYSSAQASITVTQPDGVTVDLGSGGFSGIKNYRLVSDKPAFSAWKPPMYGRYSVSVKGSINDVWGNRYSGGGTYGFWIAKRMTMATATFQGMPYPVGSRYGRDIAFIPPVPADVTVDAFLYAGSDPAKVKKISYSGTATQAGTYGSAQGAEPFILDAPGEYFAHILARYTDAEGHLWICSMKHAGVVYAEDTPVAAHGKKLIDADKKAVDRGSTKFEGHPEPAGNAHLAHINYPYNSGDVLLIAAEYAGANKIEPVMTYEMKGKPSAWDARLNGVGASNLMIRTSNGYSPHLYPEYVTEWQYYYGSAPRPGFMSRFIVGDNGVRAPYWPTTNTSFGGQIGASSNGDSPGDIYRLLGGVVIRPKDGPAMYAGYISSAFIIPKGSNDNRVIAPGSEDIMGADGKRARFFLTGLRPGLAYEIGSSIAAGVQVDPLLPVKITVSLAYPDGREKTVQGFADAFGAFAAAQRWTLDVPGVYKYRLRGEWEGHAGAMPGLPEEGGYVFVYGRMAMPPVQGMRINLPGLSYFNPAKPFTITGTTSARQVAFTALMPGAVLDQGVLDVKGGKFSYTVDPAAVNAKAPIYDIVNVKSGKPEIGRIIHISLFTEERAADGSVLFYDLQRVIIRGTQVIVTR